jgi:hypothetical protein
MKNEKLRISRVVISILSIALLSTAVTPAGAVDATGNPTYTKLNTAIAATQSALSSASSLSFNEVYLATDSKKSARKGTTLITVTPTISEYFSQNLQSTDNKKTWKSSGINGHVYVTNDKAYSIISDDHSWNAGYSSYMAFEIRKFSPFDATWVASDASGPNQNFNAMDPVATASSYVEALNAVNGYLSAVESLPSITETRNTKGEAVFKVNFSPEIPLLIYTYTVHPTTGLVTSFGYSTVIDKTKAVSTYYVSMGAEVKLPAFNPSSVKLIEQTEIIKKVRGLTAQETLRNPAELIVTHAKAAAKRARKPITSALVRKTALEIFGSEKITNVSGGVRLTGEYQGEFGFLCITVKNSKVSTKGCK